MHGNSEGRNVKILESIVNGTPYTDPPQSRVEELLIEVKEVIEEGGGGGGGGTTDYNRLNNKPSVNDNILEGDMTTSDLGITDGYIATYRNEKLTLSR
jgi:hypothetical protein